LEAAATLPGKALNVGLAIWYRAGLEGTPKVTVSNGTLSIFGVSRYAAYRAFAALGAAGLIRVDAGTGRKARITLLADGGRGADSAPPDDGQTDVRGSI
jgi:hypothetical protein